MSNNNAHNKSIKSGSRIFNRILNNSNSNENSNANNNNNTSSNSSSNSPISTGHQQQSQSTLNVITSAAAAAMSSIHNIISNGSNSLANMTQNSNSNKSTCSSSSSSANSSAQNTPNHFRDLTNRASIDDDSRNLPSNSTVITSSIKLEKKHFDKINKLTEKILKHCQSEKMNLLNSPPNIFDILPEICQIFNTIKFLYEAKLQSLNEIDYFCVLIKNCLEKFQEVVDLFKLAGKRMYEESSRERQKLVKYTLIFSHILAEMKSIFPKDVYEGQNFRIAKKDAADFWKSNFGERIIVSWKEFQIKLNNVHRISNQEVESLKDTIQLTQTKYVSIFEFDIFTRLFQPWNNLLNNWKFLVTEHPGYSAFCTYDEVHKRLQKHINKPGSYLFRLSCTKLGQWAIGYVTEGNKILQTIPQSLIQALIDGQKLGVYVYPDGRDIKIDISSAIAVTSASRIQISKEQYDMYCDMGTSFQVCKICSENNKDRKLEPCGHLICSVCLELWQETQTVPSCPFCRCEIKTFEPVIISPFENSKKIKTENHNNDFKSKDNDFSIDMKQSALKTLPQNNLLMTDCSSILSPTTSLMPSKNFSAVSTKSQNLTISDEEDYLRPNLTNNITSNNDETCSSSLHQDTDDTKFNLDMILNKKCNFKDSLVTKSLSEVVNDSKNKCNIPPAPLFPPPPPPIAQPLLPNQSQILSPPLLPPPPPPLSSTLTNNLSSIKPPTIVANHFTSKQNTIKIKIENDLIFEEFLIHNGVDRAKAACALFLANNDIKTAMNIINISKS